MFFYPWYPALMLAVESNNVIDIRLRSIATGKVDAKAETRLMISEKVDAAFEAGSMLANGRRPAEVIDFYRMHVAANAARLVLHRVSLLNRRVPSAQPLADVHGRLNLPSLTDQLLTFTARRETLHFLLRKPLN